MLLLYGSESIPYMNGLVNFFHYLFRFFLFHDDPDAVQVQDLGEDIIFSSLPLG